MEESCNRLRLSPKCVHLSSNPREGSAGLCCSTTETIVRRGASTVTFILNVTLRGDPSPWQPGRWGRPEWTSRLRANIQRERAQRHLADASRACAW
eukprot:scaffold271555_cov36-Tisochrysis_lutea.AAC.1